MIDVKLLKKSKGGSAPVGSGINTGGNSSLWRLQSLLDSKLDKSVFDDMFELVTENGVTSIHAKYGLWTKDFLSARGVNQDASPVKSGIDEKELALYLATNQYAKLSDIPSLEDYALKSEIPSLAGYATESWVEGKGYLVKHQTIHALTFQSGTFSAKTYTPNSAVQTVSIPTTTSHISEGSRLYFTDARAQNALASTVTAINNAIALKLDKSTFDTFKTDYDSWKSIVDTFMTMFTLEGTGTNRKIKANFGLYTDQFLSARGMNADGTVGGNFGLLRSWPTAAPSANTTDALGANLGWELKQRIDNLPTTSVNPYALTIQKNGTNVVVYDGSSTKTANITIAWSDTASGRPSWIGASKPTYAFTELTSHPTTLAGYGITNAKIASGVITLGGNSITPLVEHQTIYSLSFVPGTFAAKTYTPNSATQTVNIPTTTSHISEGSRLYFTDARAQSALKDTVTALQSDIDSKVSKAGDTMTGTLTIGIDKASVNHLAFSRASWNYISATSAGGILVFSTNGVGPSSTGGTLYLEGKNGRPGQNNVGSWGTSSLRWSNLYSVLGNFSGLITASGGIEIAAGKKLKIGSITIEEVDGNLHIDKGVYSDSFVSAKGANTSGSSDGGVSYNRLNKWSEYSADKSGYVLSAGLGYDLYLNKLDATKAAIEGLLTGNITSHTHSQYLTAISKAQVEAVLTGNITSHTHSQYVLSSALSAYLLKSAYTASDVLSKLLTVDGAGSGIDADLLDGKHNGELTAIKYGITQVSALDANLYFGDTYNGYMFYGGGSTQWTNLHSDIIDANAKWMWVFKISSYSGQLSAATNGRLYYRVGKSDSTGSWNKIAYTTDNVASATKLQTSRTIWGQPFDGTANVSGIFSLGASYAEATSSGNRKIKYSGSGISLIHSASSAFGMVAYATDGTTSLGSIAGSYAVNDVLKWFFYGGTYNSPAIAILGSGNVGIGTTTPSEKLQVLGTTRTSNLIIGSTTASEHIKFSRGNMNYITAPENGQIGFIPNGKSIAIANCDLTVKDGEVAVSKLKIGSITLEDVDGNLHIDNGVYSDSFVSAKGANTSGSSGGGVSYNRLNKWSEYSADKSGYVLSAGLGYDLYLNKADKTWVESKNYLTAITKAQVEAVLTGNITSHTHSQYALSSALSSYLLKSAYTASDVLSKLLTVDGAGSGIDADLLDGKHNGELSAVDAEYLKIFDSITPTTHTTVKAGKDALIALMDNHKQGIGYPIYIGASFISNWGSEAVTPVASSSYTVIKIGGSYAGSKHGQWLLSSYGDTRIKVIGRTNDGWTAMRTLATTDDNVASATKLADNSDFKAWGQTFFSNGKPQTVSGNLTGVGSITMNGSISRLFADGNTRTVLTATGTAAGDSTLIYGDVQSNSMIRGLGISFQNAVGTTIMKIVDGNVGIGTTTPSEKLQVLGTTRTSNLIIGSTAASEHIKFSRGSYNYITAPESGIIAFIANGKSVASTNIDLMISDGLTTVKKLKIGSITLEDVGGNLHIDKGVYSDSFVSAKGANTSGSGGVSYNRLNNWSEYSADKSGYVLSAGLGYDLYLNKLDATKGAIEGLLTGNITTHTHSQYLTAITKAQVEAVLTGNITSHTLSQYALSSALSAYLLKSAYTASDVLSKLLTVDGAGSGLDADLLDGKHNGELTAIKYGITQVSALDANLYFGDTYNGYMYYGGGSTQWTNLHPDITDANAKWMWVFKISSYSGQWSAATNGRLYYRVGKSDSTGSWNKIAYTTDNVASATKLQTSRTIWGQPFDGTANVSGILSLGASYAEATSSGNRKIKYSGSGISLIHSASSAFGMVAYATDGTTCLGSIAGSYAVNDVLKWFFYGGTYSSPAIAILGSGNVGIGTTTPSEKLQVLGTTRTSNLIIGSTAASEHIKFSRSNYNYITAPENGTIAFVVNGQSIGSANSDLIISDGLVTVKKLKIGNITLEDVGGNLRINKGVYSDSFVSAKGANTSGSSGGVSYNRLNKWSEYSADKSGYVLSAGLGYDLYLNKADKTWVEAKNYLTAITKAQVEAVLTGNITSHTHSQYALSSALSAYLLKSAYTASDVLSKLLTVDGSGSGLDADLLDGKHAGNASGNVPVSNGTVNTNLYAQYASNIVARTMVADDDFDTLSNFSTAKSSGFVACNISSFTVLAGIGKNATIVSYGYGNRVFQLQSQAFNDGTPNNRLKWRSVINNGASAPVQYTFGDWHSIAFTDSNVASADRLSGTTTRTAWGQTFFTTGGVPQSISGNMTSVGNITGSAAMTISSANGRLTLNGAATALDLKFANTDAKSVILNGTAFKPFDAATNALTLGSSSAVWSSVYARNYTSDTTTYLSSGSATSSVIFRIGTTEIARFLQPNGYLGLGTTAPAYRLDVNGVAHASALRLNQIAFECDKEGSDTDARASEINAYGTKLYLQHNSTTALICCVGGGNVGIGTNTPSYKLDVSGVMHSTVGVFSDGYVSAKGQNTSSDQRLKRNFNAFEIALHQIAFAPSVSFDWKDGSHDVGTIAQYWKKINPFLTPVGPDGYLTLQYGKTALLGLITMAKKVKSHEERIAELERENKELKHKLEIIERR